MDVKIVRFAQALILIHGTICAVHGLIQYAQAAGDWANEQFGDNTSKIRLIK